MIGLFTEGPRDRVATKDVKCRMFELVKTVCAGAMRGSLTHHNKIAVGFIGMNWNESMFG